MKILITGGAGFIGSNLCQHFLKLMKCLRSSLASFDPLIASIESIYSVQRNGNVPHSQASIEKIKKILHYDPKFDTRK
ncbi:unnamed protein product, partial [Rotaria sp. Silwood1]